MDSPKKTIKTDEGPPLPRSTKAKRLTSLLAIQELFDGDDDLQDEAVTLAVGKWRGYELELLTWLQSFPLGPSPALKELRQWDKKEESTREEVLEVLKWRTEECEKRIEKASENILAGESGAETPPDQQGEDPAQESGAGVAEAPPDVEMEKFDETGAGVVEAPPDAEMEKFKEPEGEAEEAPSGTPMTLTEPQGVGSVQEAPIELQGAGPSQEESFQEKTPRRKMSAETDAELRALRAELKRLEENMANFDRQEESQKTPSPANREETPALEVALKGNEKVHEAQDAEPRQEGPKRLKDGWLAEYLLKGNKKRRERNAREAGKEPLPDDSIFIPQAEREALARLEEESLQLSAHEAEEEGQSAKGDPEPIDPTQKSGGHHEPPEEDLDAIMEDDQEALDTWLGEDLTKEAGLEKGSNAPLKKGDPGYVEVREYSDSELNDQEEMEDEVAPDPVQPSVVEAPASVRDEDSDRTLSPPDEYMGRRLSTLATLPVPKGTMMDGSGASALIVDLNRRQATMPHRRCDVILSPVINGDYAGIVPQDLNLSAIRAWHRPKISYRQERWANGEHRKDRICSVVMTQDLDELVAKRGGPTPTWYKFDDMIPHIELTEREARYLAKSYTPHEVGLTPDMFPAPIEKEWWERVRFRKARVEVPWDDDDERRGLPVSYPAVDFTLETEDAIGFGAYEGELWKNRELEATPFRYSLNWALTMKHKVFKDRVQHETETEGYHGPHSRGAIYCAVCGNTFNSAQLAWNHCMSGAHINTFRLLTERLVEVGFLERSFLEIRWREPCFPFGSDKLARHYRPSALKKAAEDYANFPDTPTQNPDEDFAHGDYFIVLEGKAVTANPGYGKKRMNDIYPLALEPKWEDNPLKDLPSMGADKFKELDADWRAMLRSAVAPDGPDDSAEHLENVASARRKLVRAVLNLTASRDTWFHLKRGAIPLDMTEEERAWADRYLSKTMPPLRGPQGTKRIWKVLGSLLAPVPVNGRLPSLAEALHLEGCSRDAATKEAEAAAVTEWHVLTMFYMMKTIKRFCRPALHPWWWQRSWSAAHKDLDFQILDEELEQVVLERIPTDGPFANQVLGDLFAKGGQGFVAVTSQPAESSPAHHWADVQQYWIDLLVQECMALMGLSPKECEGVSNEEWCELVARLPRTSHWLFGHVLAARAVPADGNMDSDKRRKMSEGLADGMENLAGKLMAECRMPLLMKLVRCILHIKEGWGGLYQLKTKATEESFVGGATRKIQPVPDSYIQGLEGERPGLPGWLPYTCPSNLCWPKATLANGTKKGDTFWGCAPLIGTHSGTASVHFAGPFMLGLNTFLRSTAGYSACHPDIYVRLLQEVFLKPVGERVSLDLERRPQGQPVSVAGLVLSRLDGLICGTAAWAMPWIGTTIQSQRALASEMKRQLRAMGAAAADAAKLALVWGRVWLEDKTIENLHYDIKAWRAKDLPATRGKLVSGAKILDASVLSLRYEAYKQWPTVLDRDTLLGTVRRYPKLMKRVLRGEAYPGEGISLEALKADEPAKQTTVLIHDKAIEPASYRDKDPRILRARMYACVGLSQERVRMVGEANDRAVHRALKEAHEARRAQLDQMDLRLQGTGFDYWDSCRGRTMEEEIAMVTRNGVEMDTTLLALSFARQVAEGGTPDLTRMDKVLEESQAAEDRVTSGAFVLPPEKEAPREGGWTRVGAGGRGVPEGGSQRQLSSATTNTPKERGPPPAPKTSAKTALKATAKNPTPPKAPWAKVAQELSLRGQREVEGEDFSQGVVLRTAKEVVKTAPPIELKTADEAAEARRQTEAIEAQRLEAALREKRRVEAVRGPDVRCISGWAYPSGNVWCKRQWNPHSRRTELVSNYLTKDELVEELEIINRAQIDDRDLGYRSSSASQPSWQDRPRKSTEPRLECHFTVRERMRGAPDYRKEGSTMPYAIRTEAARDVYFREKGEPRAKKIYMWDLDPHGELVTDADGKEYGKWFWHVDIMGGPASRHELTTFEAYKAKIAEENNTSQPPPLTPKPTPQPPRPKHRPEVTQNIIAKMSSFDQPLWQPRQEAKGHTPQGDPQPPAQVATKAQPKGLPLSPEVRTPAEPVEEDEPRLPPFQAPPLPTSAAIGQVRPPPPKVDAAATVKATTGSVVMQTQDVHALTASAEQETRSPKRTKTDESESLKDMLRELMLRNEELAQARAAPPPWMGQMPFFAGQQMYPGFGWQAPMGAQGFGPQGPTGGPFPFQGPWQGSPTSQMEPTGIVGSQKADQSPRPTTVVASATGAPLPSRSSEPPPKGLTASQMAWMEKLERRVDSLSEAEKATYDKLQKKFLESLE